MLDIATIYLALQLSAPSLNARTSYYYSKVIFQQSIKRDIDPLLIISIAKHESHWNARLISEDLEDYGLLQVRARFVGMPSSSLLEGGTNIRVGSAFITSSQDFCRKILKREPETQEYLACYQGSCKSYRTFCKPTNLSFKVDSYKQCLYDSLLDQTDYNCDSIYRNYKYDGHYPIENH